MYYLVKESREALERNSFLCENDILHYAKRTLFGSYELSEGVKCSMKDLESTSVFQKVIVGNENHAIFGMFSLYVFNVLPC